MGGFRIKARCWGDARDGVSFRVIVRKRVGVWLRRGARASQDKTCECLLSKAQLRGEGLSIWLVSEGLHIGRYVIINDHAQRRQLCRRALGRPDLVTNLGPPGEVLTYEGGGWGGVGRWWGGGQARVPASWSGR